MFSKSSTSIDGHIQTFEKRIFAYKLAIAEQTSLISQYNTPTKPSEEIWCSVYLNGEFVELETKKNLEDQIKKNENYINILNKIKINEAITVYEYNRLMKIPALTKDFQICEYKNISYQEEKKIFSLHGKNQI